MKRIALILGAGILLVTGLLVTTNAYAANLLTNPGFESGSLSGWSCTGSGSGSSPAPCTPARTRSTVTPPPPTPPSARRR